MMGKRPLSPVLHHPIKALISDTINNLFFSSVSTALTQEQVFIMLYEDSKFLLKSFL